MLFPSVAGGQHRRLPASPLPTNYYLNFSNPTNHKIWRSGTQYTGIINIPTGYTTPSWQIIDHSTGSIVTSGASYNVSYTFTYGSGCNVYDLIVTTTKLGYPTLVNAFPGEFTCLPPVFTEVQADLVLDLSGSGIGYQTDNWVDRGLSGNIYKVFVKGNYTGTGGFFPTRFRSTVDNKPVHFIFSNVTITSSSFNFNPSAFQNTIFDGCSDESVQYGINLIKSVGGADQNFIYYATDGTFSSRRVMICGIHTNNLQHTIGGSAGFQISTSNSVAFNYDNYTFDQLTCFNCLTEWTGGEGYYILHFTDFPDGSGRAFSGVSNGLYFRLNASNTSNDGFQFGSNFNSDVFNCRWVTTGLGQGTGQRNILQWSDGNRSCAFYMNYLEGDNDGWSAFTGRRGKDMEFFSNVIYSNGPAVGSGISNFIKMEQNDTYASMYWGIYNNTFRFGSLVANAIPWSLYNDTVATTTIFNSLAIVDNIMVSDTTTEYFTVNSFNTTNLLINEYLTTDKNAVLFFNEGAKNLRLGSVNSPAFRSRTSITKVHRLSNYDYEGMQFLSTHDVSGAYSGYEFFTGLNLPKNILSIASLPDVNVPHNTSFTTANTYLLPQKVLATIDDGSTRNCSVVWSQGTYDGTVSNTYNLSGTITLPSDITNTLNIVAHVNTIVLAALPAVNIKINNFTGASTGWFQTGGITPSAGVGTTIDYGEIIINGTPTGIGIRALNVSSGQWTGLGSGGGTSSVGFPNAVRLTYWYTQSASGASLELYEITAGALTNRLYTINILGSRASITPPRTSKYIIVNNNVSQSINIGTSNGNGNDTLITFNNCLVVNGVLKITVQGIAPNDANPFAGHINGFTLDSQ